MRKAGKIEIGEAASKAAIAAGKARLLIIAADASDNAKKKASGFLVGRRALYVPLPHSKSELSDALGRTSDLGMAVTTDFGLSAAFMQALSEQYPDKYTELKDEMTKRAEKAAKRKAAGPKKKSGRKQDGI